MIMNIPMSFISDRLSHLHPQIIRSRSDSLEVTDTCCIVSEKEESYDGAKYALCIGAVPEKLKSSNCEIIVQLDAAADASATRGVLYQAKAEYDAWNVRLMEAITDGSDLNGFLTEGKSLIKCPLAVENLFGQTLAHTDDYTAVASEQAVRNRNTFAVSHDGRQFAILRLDAAPDKISDGTCALAAHFVYMLELYYRAFGVANRHSVESYDIIGDMIDGRKVERSIVEMHLSRRGWRAADRYRVVAVSNRLEPLDGLGTDHLMKTFRAAFPQSIYYTDDKKTIIVVNLQSNDNKDAVGEYLRDQFTNSSLVFGISPEFSNYYLLQKYGQYALYAMAKASTDGKNAVDYNSVKNLYLADYLREAERIGGNICSAQAEKLEAADVGSNQLVKTLYMSLVCGMNNAATARKLYIDRNSLVYRLNKISSILDYDVTKLSQDEYGYLYLMLSCYIIIMRKKSADVYQHSFLVFVLPVQMLRARTAALSMAAMASAAFAASPTT